MTEVKHRLSFTAAELATLEAALVAQLHRKEKSFFRLYDEGFNDQARNARQSIIATKDLIARVQTPQLKLKENPDDKQANPRKDTEGNADEGTAGKGGQAKS